MPQFEMICLANSRKMSGRCIAGLRTDGQGWIRPVVGAGPGTLFPGIYNLQDGTEPRLLDVIRVGCSRPRAEPHQPENWVIDSTPWQLVERPASTALRPILRSGVVAGPDLLGDTGAKQDYHGFLVTPAPASLTLVVPRQVQWHITTGSRGNRQTKARFSLSATNYELSVTDPVWTQRLDHLAVGLYDADAAVIAPDERLVFTVSLSEPANWDQCCYKLVAAVIVVPKPQPKRA